MLNYIIWDVSPEIFRIDWFSVRWYGLLFASGFLFGVWIFGKIFKAEGKPEKDLDVLLLFMVVGTVVGARLGHCLFYQPDYYLANPIEILKVWEGGLASHGAAIAIVIALLLYARKRPDQGFWWLADRIVIVVALGGALIRMGNLMNSEIIGKPTSASYGFIFTHSLDDDLQRAEEKFVKVSKSQIDRKDTLVAHITYQPLRLDMYFDNELTTEQAQQSVQTNLPAIISSGRGEVSKHYKIFNPMLKVTAKKDGRYTIASTEVYGIPRHPSQFYEAITYFLLFGLLLWLYNIRKERTPAGQLFGVFMIVCFGFRFMVEFLKENQVDFEGNLALNMGQLLSIPAILAGVVAVVISLRAKTKA